MCLCFQSESVWDEGVGAQSGLAQSDRTLKRFSLIYAEQGAHFMRWEYIRKLEAEDTCDIFAQVLQLGGESGPSTLLSTKT